jgi:hypothetical protein
MVAKFRERLAVNKQRSHRFHKERFSLEKLNEVEINSAWEMIRENVKNSAKERLGYFEFYFLDRKGDKSYRNTAFFIRSYQTF